MKVLQILSHPDYNNKKRVSNRLACVGEQYLKSKGITNLKTINLYSPDSYIPVMDKYMFSYPVSRENNRDSHVQKSILKQWLSADTIFIYMPLHNFNVTSKFKDYIDNIVIVNKTFKCQGENLIGLDNSDKRVFFILTSGGEFDKNFQYVNLDFAVSYLRGILSVMGINNMYLLRVQGLDLSWNNKEQIVQTAEKDLCTLINNVLFEKN